MAALTLFQRKNLILGIVSPQQSLYAPNIGGTYDPTHPVALVFDVIETEENEIENVGTTNPLENGAFVSDTIRTMPEKASFKATISQATLADILGIPQGSVLTDSDDRVMDAYNWVHDVIMKGKAIFDMVSGLKVYQNYFMTNFKVMRDSSSAMALSCSFTIQELNIVSSQTVSARGISTQPTPQLGTGGAPSSVVPPQNVGNQPTQTANPSEQDSNNTELENFSESFLPASGF